MNKLKKILIVDDEDMFRSTLFDVISELGSYEIDTASDGEEAFVKALKNPPDLILLDILMPKMHGYAFCQKIRADEKLKDIKIIMLSAKGYKSDIDKALDIGADDFLLKPVNFEILKEKITKLIGNKNFLIRFWGTRGSIPTPGRKYERYGGNTPCVEVRVNQQLIIFDCGTGIRELGIALMDEFKEDPINAHIFISHTHWDHIQGLPFFTPGYVSNNTFTIYGPLGADRNIEKIIRGQYDSDYFPVSLSDLSAELKFLDLTEEKIDIEGIKISHVYLNHPGLTLGFKLEYGGVVVIYATDNEPENIILLDRLEEENKLQYEKNFVNFIKGADILITDTQYTDEEYKIKVGWGHSPMGAILDLAAKAEVKKLYFFHHDPMHSDEFIDKMMEEANKKIKELNSKVICFVATEKQIIEI